MDFFHTKKLKEIDMQLPLIFQSGGKRLHQKQPSSLLLPEWPQGPHPDLQAGPFSTPSTPTYRALRPGARKPYERLASCSASSEAKSPSPFNHGPLSIHRSASFDCLEAIFPSSESQKITHRDQRFRYLSSDSSSKSVSSSSTRKHIFPTKRPSLSMEHGSLSCMIASSPLEEHLADLCIESDESLDFSHPMPASKTEWVRRREHSHSSHGLTALKTFDDCIAALRDALREVETIDVEATIPNQCLQTASSTNSSSESYRRSRRPRTADAALELVSDKSSSTENQEVYSPIHMARREQVRIESAKLLRQDDLISIKKLKTPIPSPSTSPLALDFPKSDRDEQLLETSRKRDFGLALSPPNSGRDFGFAQVLNIPRCAGLPDSPVGESPRHASRSSPIVIMTPVGSHHESAQSQFFNAARAPSLRLKTTSDDSGSPGEHRFQSPLPYSKQVKHPGPTREPGLSGSKKGRNRKRLDNNASSSSINLVAPDSAKNIPGTEGDGSGKSDSNSTLVDDAFQSSDRSKGDPERETPNLKKYSLAPPVVAPEATIRSCHGSTEESPNGIRRCLQDRETGTESKDCPIRNRSLALTFDAPLRHLLSASKRGIRGSYERRMDRSDTSSALASSDRERNTRSLGPGIAPSPENKPRPSEDIFNIIRHRKNAGRQRMAWEHEMTRSMDAWGDCRTPDIALSSPRMKSRKKPLNRPSTSSGELSLFGRVPNEGSRDMASARGSLSFEAGSWNFVRITNVAHQDGSGTGEETSSRAFSEEGTPAPRPSTSQNELNAPSNRALSLSSTSDDPSQLQTSRPKAHSFREHVRSFKKNAALSFDGFAIRGRKPGGLPEGQSCSILPSMSVQPNFADSKGGSFQGSNTVCSVSSVERECYRGCKDGKEEEEVVVGDVCGKGDLGLRETLRQNGDEGVPTPAPLQVEDTKEDRSNLIDAAPQSSDRSSMNCVESPVRTLAGSRLSARAASQTKSWFKRPSEYLERVRSSRTSSNSVLSGRGDHELDSSPPRNEKLEPGQSGLGVTSTPRGSLRTLWKSSTTITAGSVRRGNKSSSTASSRL
ncbi:hypothetical protein IE53DRAFT_380031 [Violaceomyces palustris]|uniref:Uncharacterized protein n=1 Tax=Violaceomyces palustris TaxID=1673888 RepID=A0ACD0NWI0_9BASI|nr:hypothetical protein IE53DRAFT_380031 [Violaceomyces palustris]